MWRGVQKEAHSVTFDLTCIFVEQVATGMTGSKESCKVLQRCDFLSA